MDQSASKSLHFLNYKKNDISETNSRRLGGLLALGITGSVIVGLYAVVFPFVSPALRKICLPFVPATNAQVQNVMTALRRIRRRTTNENVIDLGSGDGRLVRILFRNSCRHFLISEP